MPDPGFVRSFYTREIYCMYLFIKYQRVFALGQLTAGLYLQESVHLHTRILHYIRTDFCELELLRPIPDFCAVSTREKF